jgi:hypothetical protein
MPPALRITKPLLPNVQALITYFVIEATDLAGSQKIADHLRRGLNLPDDSPQAKINQIKATAQKNTGRCASPSPLGSCACTHLFATLPSHSSVVQRWIYVGRIFLRQCLQRLAVE